MPQMETPAELAEYWADSLGIYSAAEEHKEDCQCRVCFVSDMTARIRDSVKNEQILTPVFVDTSHSTIAAPIADHCTCVEDPNVLTIGACNFCTGNGVPIMFTVTDQSAKVAELESERDQLKAERDDLKIEIEELTSN
jgi:hypothetical protein